MLGGPCSGKQCSLPLSCPLVTLLSSAVSGRNPVCSWRCSSSSSLLGHGIKAGSGVTSPNSENTNIVWGQGKEGGRAVISSKIWTEVVIGSRLTVATASEQ